MRFTQSLLVAVIGLGSVSLAAPAPAENDVAVEAAPRPPCTWITSLTGADCDDDEDEDDRRSSSGRQPWRGQPKTPAAPKPGNTGGGWQGSTPKGGGWQGSTPQGGGWQGSTPQPARPSPQPAPRPAAPPAAAQGGSPRGEAASTWCDRPNEARRPAYCNSVPADTASNEDGWIGSTPDKPSSSITSGQNPAVPKPATVGNGGGWLGQGQTAPKPANNGGGRGSSGWGWGGRGSDDDDDERRKTS